MATAATEMGSPGVEAFAGRVIGDASATFVTVLAAMGDRLGLFKALAMSGAATSAELASRAGIHERYAREWCGGMASAGYLTYDSETGRFELPAEHAPALAEEGGAFFMGGAYQQVLALGSIYDALTAAFRHGGGVPQSAYDERFWEGMERFTAVWYNNLLVQKWLPSLPDVQARLERGVEFADVGCGRGRAILRLAQEFPASSFTGYDVLASNIEAARAHAEHSGVAGRVSFEVLDASRGLPRKFDVITTFDVVHDAADPLALLRSIREGLAEDGTYVCVDINCSHRLEENRGPLGALFHGVSLLYCMTTSLANGGAGLGTLGLHEHRLQEYAAAAGFRAVRRAFQDPFNNLYELR